MAAGIETKERVIFIEYSGKEIFSFVTHKPFKFHDGTEAICTEFYEVEWCKRDQQYYFHNSGSGVGEALTVYGNVGGTTTYWAARDVKVEVKGDAKVRRVVRSKGRKGIEKALDGDWSDTFSESECEYCPTCDDYLPVEYTNLLCDHVWWCDAAGWWSKPGERCNWDCEDCRDHHLEANPKPVMLTLAEGYAMGASPLAKVVRRLLDGHKFTPEMLAGRLSWCGEGLQAIEMALHGVVSEDLVSHHVNRVATVMGLTADEEVELIEAFKCAGSDAFS